jgi:nitroreductase
VVIIVCFDATKIEAVRSPSSIHAAVQNILLVAASLDYGSCPTTGSDDLAKAVLKLPAP